MKCLVDHLRQLQEDFMSFTNQFHHAKLFRDFENIARVGIDFTRFYKILIVWLFDDRFVGLLKLKSSVSAVAPKTNGNMAYGIHNSIKTSPLLVKTKLP